MTTQTLRERITGILDPIKTNPPIRWDILLEEQCNDILDLILQEKISVLREVMDTFNKNAVRDKVNNEYVVYGVFDVLHATIKELQIKEGK